MDWAQLWQDIVNYFTNNIWGVIWFFAALLIGIIVIKILMAVLRRVFGKTHMEKISQQFLLAVIKFLLWLVLVLVLLSILGIAITGLLTALSAVLLAVGMALEANIANLANGIIIVACHMFKKGDYIIVGDVEGSITNINFLFTTITTKDNKRVTLPNSIIVNSAVTNTGANKSRRVDFVFSVAYESDVEQIKSIIKDVMQSNGKVYIDDEHAPFCRLKTLGASSIDFFAYCWCDSGDYWDVYYYVVETVYNEFKRNNISIPYTQLEVRSRTDKVVMPYDKAPLPVREEKPLEEKKATVLEKIFKEDVSGKPHGKKSSKKAKADGDSTDSADKLSIGDTPSPKDR